MLNPMRSRLSVRDVVAVAAFLAVGALLGWRVIEHWSVPGQPLADDKWALCDFRDAIYYPVVALLNGENAYASASYMERYPVKCEFPLFLPATLIVHLPFGLLPFVTAESVYFLLTVALTPALAVLALVLAGARVTVTRVFVIATLVLISRPGYWNLVLGQLAVTMAVAIYLALLPHRRWTVAAGLGLAFAMVKPTFGVPLTILMLARGQIREVISGAIVALGLSLPAVVVLSRAAGGFREFLPTVLEPLAYHSRDVNTDALLSPFRVDAAAVFSHILGVRIGPLGEAAVTALVLALGVACVCCLRRARAPEGDRLSAIVICLTSVVCCYHQAYDLVVLLFPCAAFAWGSWTASNGSSSWPRWTACIALLLVGANHLRAPSVVQWMNVGGKWLVAIEVLNGALLLVTLAVCGMMTHRCARTRQVS
ncbi:MAG: glycosyltransferase family 87 protein [Planctomycetota bacterium]